MAAKKRQRLTKALAKQACALSRHDKLRLAEALFGCELETDNIGQYLVYTGLTMDENTHKVRELNDKDFESM